MDGYPRAVLRRGALLLLSALVAGCGALPGPTPQPEPLTSTAETTSETFTSPTTEDTTTTTADPDPDEDPIISLARLPIGGVSTVGDDPTRQCVGVSWIVTTEANPVIPPGYAVEVRGAVFSAPGFAVVRGGCGTAKPNCLGHIMRVGRDTCDLAVRSLPTADPGVEVKVALTGTLYCPKRVGKAACQRFADAVAKEPGITIPLELPPPSTTTSSGGGTGTASGVDGARSPTGSGA